MSCNKKASSEFVGKGSLNDLILNSKEKILVNKVFNLKGGSIYLSNKVLEITEKGAVFNAVIECNGCEVRGPEGSFKGSFLKGNYQAKEIKFSQFVDSENEDASRNFKILENLSSCNTSIILDDIHPILAPSTTSSISTNYPIRIKGNNPETSGLVLETKHKNIFYNYFKTNSGNNVNLSNITIVTREFLENKKVSEKNQYRLFGGYYHDQYNPSIKNYIDSFQVNDCIIKGAVSIASFSNSSKNQNLEEWRTTNKIRNLTITGNQFYNCTTSFAFGNMGYDDVIVENNRISNLSQTFLSFSASGIEMQQYYPALMEKRGNVFFRGNHFENDQVVAIEKGRTLSPIVIKGGDGHLVFENNTFKNLLSNSIDAQVNTWYWTCTSKGSTEIVNNTFKNVIGYGGPSRPASLVKQRGATNINILNNSFIVEREALVKIGAVKSINTPLSVLDNSGFLCEFIQTGSGVALNKRYKIIGNTFKVPYINKSTEIYDTADLLMENNSIDIDYFGVTGKQISVSEDGVMWLSRKRYDRPKSQSIGNLIWRNNKIKIDDTQLKEIKWFWHSRGTQAGSKSSKEDLNYNYKQVLINDQISVKNVLLRVTLSDAENQTYYLNLQGNNSGFAIDSYDGVGHLRPNARKLNSIVNSNEISLDTKEGFFALIPNSDQLVNINKHSGEDLVLMDYSYLTSLYPLSKLANTPITINVNYTSKTGETGFASWLLIIDNQKRSFHLIDESGRLKSIAPNSKKGKEYNFLSTGFKKPKLKVVGGKGASENALLVLYNTKDVKQLSIQCLIDEKPMIEISKKSISNYKELKRSQK